MFKPLYKIVKSVLHRSRHFQLPGRADVSYKQVKKTIELGNKLIVRLRIVKDKRIAKQLLRKANLYMIDASDVEAESYIEQNPKLRDSFWATIKELNNVIKSVKKRMG